MNNIDDLKDIKNRLQILVVHLDDIIKGFENDSITHTKRAYQDFLDITHADCATSYECDVEERVMRLLENIMYW